MFWGVMYLASMLMFIGFVEYWTKLRAQIQHLRESHKTSFVERQALKHQLQTKGDALEAEKQRCLTLSEELSAAVVDLEKSQKRRDDLENLVSKFSYQLELIQDFSYEEDLDGDEGICHF